ncbi:uncharacterized protein LOC130798179 [Amaranthus tricolor]|uniref:uncharacterized protein LOC130798179 n=1 Tax=Amaranthus tricolor TaxID=29722 RepID=UPI00259039C4|nr:uncharacterized protein LOC130798179 [Amaranthus tricolor]
MTTKIQQISGASFSLSSQSPSFTAFSSENIADIAARVIKELNLSHDDPFDDDFYSNFALNDASQDTQQNDTVEKENEEEEIKNSEDEESEFEFAILSGEDNSPPISADEIFSNGKIKPMFHVFNTDLIYGYGRYEYDYKNGASPQTLGLPLRKLLQESQNGNGKSSSQADDLNGVPSGTFCVWTPRKKGEVMKMRKRSKSTGSSKRWRIKDLLKTINGNDHRDEKKKKGGFHGEKKKSYLPYRQDLVGLFANVNGISRTVRPF